MSFDVALSGMARSGIVRGETGLWLVREVEESLAHASGFLWVLHAFELVDFGDACKSQHLSPGSEGLF